MEQTNYKFQDVCEIVTDYVANGSFKSLADNVQYSDKKDYARLIRLVDYNNNYDEKNAVWVPESSYNFLKKSVLYGDEVIISNVGANLGTVFKCPKLNYPMTLGPNSLLVRTNDLCNQNYLYYYLKSKIGYSKLMALVSGSAMPKFNKTELRNMEISLPDREYQDKVAEVLIKIDKKIELNNEINNNLHDLAEQQFNEIYSLGSPKKLDELLFNVSTGSRPKGGAQESGIPSIGAEKIEKFGIYDYSSEKYISEDYYEKLKNGKINSGDVLLYKDGAYTGKVSMSLDGFPHNKAAVNEHVFILNTENNWAQNYLYFVLYNKDNKEMLHRLASSKAAQPGLNQVELKSIEINICDKDDILKFENSVKPIMEKIALNSLENKRLAELRDTLLPKLMNGEIELDNIEI